MVKLLREHWRRLKIKKHMEFKSVQKYVITSPKKLREVAVLLKKLKPEDAVNKLPFLQKRAAEPLLKVIKTAIAQAGQKGITSDKLIFKEVQINEGPRLKRGRPVSRGRWHPYKRRMSHIRVVLAEDPKVSKEAKNGTKS